MKSLKEIADLEVLTSRDYDPEAVDDFGHDDHSDSNKHGDTDDVFAGREHYEAVGKSKLRKPAESVLGKEYGGSAISREALSREDEESDDPLAPADDGESDDPFASDKEGGDLFARSGEEEDSEVEEEEIGVEESRGGNRKDINSPAEVLAEENDFEDDEIDSDEAFGEEDAETFKDFKFLGSKSRPGREPGDDEENNAEGDEKRYQDATSEDASDAASQQSVDGMEDAEHDESDFMGDDSISHSSMTSESSSQPPAQSTDREKLKALLTSDAAAVASSLSAAVNADITKGRAVKRQYQTFDRLLDTRIKLQKGVTASNDVLPTDISDEEAQAVVRKAEEAALNLWSTLESLRHSILETQQPPMANKKRKQPPPPGPATPASELWARTQFLESTSVPYRRAVLDKWSAKTRASNPTPSDARPQLLTGSLKPAQNHITSVLDVYLASEGSKVVDASTSTTTASSYSYTDTPFYQSLLRDLIASRSHSHPDHPQSLTVASSAVPIPLHEPGSKHKKAAGTVDTKASKGRKIRYTVHEKLLNFCAPEVRETWAEAGRAELFASLFGGLGGAGGLMEEEEEADGDGGRDQDGIEEGLGREGEALRLFRS